MCCLELENISSVHVRGRVVSEWLVSPAVCPSPAEAEKVAEVAEIHYNQMIMEKKKQKEISQVPIHDCCTWKCDCLGCAVLLCPVSLFGLACFFLPSFSLKHVRTCIYMYMYVHISLAQHVHAVCQENLHVCT